MKATRTTAAVLSAAMAATLLAGCGGSSATSTAASTSTESTAESTSTAAAAPTGEKQTLEYWYHSADPVTDAYFEDYFDKINAEQDQYEIKYTSFSFADFQEKFQMAVSTDTMPDVVSLGFSNVATFTAQDSLLPLDDYLDQIETLDKIDSSMVDSMRNIGGGTLYGIPYAYNQEVAWYNTAKFKEKGIDAPPATQKEFLEDCEKYADPANSSYFYSLRGVRPYDSLVAWLWTYTDGLGYDGSWFDENGKCILGDAKFAEALDTYANLYKNNEVSGDSINNNFSQIVAEFGSGVSMYIIHNSSSESTHLTNLGEGNFAAARVLANDEGHYFASGLQPNVYCITNQGDDHDYSGAVWLMNVLLDAECEGGMCQTADENGSVELPQWGVAAGAALFDEMAASDPCGVLAEYPGALLAAFTGGDAELLSEDTVALVQNTLATRDLPFVDMTNDFPDANHNYQAAEGSAASDAEIAARIENATAEFLVSALR